MNDAGRRGDFLANVIERANERAPVVRPRPAALFEPVATSLHMDFSADEARDAVRGDEQREPLKGAAAAPADAGARHVVPRVSASFDEYGEATLEHRRREPAWIPPRTELLHEMPRAAAQESVATQHAMPSPLRARNLSTPPLAAPEPARVRVRHEPRAADVAEADAPGENALPRVRTREPEPDQARVARLLPVAQIAIGSAVAAADANRQLSSHAASSAASVTISIGRVEVRAAPASTQGQGARAKSARAPMRLDEYLAGRERKR